MSTTNVSKLNTSTHRVGVPSAEEPMLVRAARYVSSIQLTSFQCPTISLPSIQLQSCIPKGWNIQFLTRWLNSLNQCLPQSISFQCFNSINNAFLSCMGSLRNSLNSVFSGMESFNNISNFIQNVFTPAYDARMDEIDIFADMLVAKNEGSVQYYSQDAIDNLQLRVTFRKIDTLREVKDDDEYKEFVATVKWQKKIFSPRELLHYHSMTETKTTLDMRYRKEVKKLVKKVEKLASSPTPQYDQNENKTKEEEMTKQNEDKTKINEKRIPKDLIDYKQIKFTNPFGSNGFKDILQHRIFTHVHVDDFHTDMIQVPIDEENYKKVDKKGHTDFYIMASIGTLKFNEKAEWEGDEYCLCIIRAYPDGSIIMKPGLSCIPNDDDFTEEISSFRQYSKKLRFKDIAPKKYNFRAKDGNVYQYTIHLFNDYPKRKQIDEIRKKIINQLHDRAYVLRRNLVGLNFKLAPHENYIRYYLFGEIVSASFNCDEYFVKYFVDLPSNFKLEFNAQLSSTTQIARNDGNIAYFNFPFEFHLNFERTFVLPKMYFLVTSVDFWGSHRVEGYGYLSFPLEAGIYNYDIKCWKPKGSIRSSLKSFFIGGSAVLNDISYTAIPKGFNQIFLNRFGFVTESSGSLRIRIHVITQQQQVAQNWKFEDLETPIDLKRSKASTTIRRRR